MAKDPTLKKKRKSEAAGMDVDPPVAGTASASAVVADVEEPSKKKSKKEKKSKGDETVDGDVTEKKSKKEKKDDVSRPALNSYAVN